MQFIALSVLLVVLVAAVQVGAVPTNYTEKWVCGTPQDRSDNSTANWENWYQKNDVRPNATDALLSSRKRGVMAGNTTITVVFGAGVTDQTIQDTFLLAAELWAAVLMSPIEIVVNFDIATLAAGVLGSTNSVQVSVASGTAISLYETALGLPAGTITQPLPVALPPGLSLSGSASGGKANFKAIVPDASATLDSMFGTSDGSILFSDQFNFDFDPSDGITPGSFSFLAVSIHEIGHLLGFFSEVDTADFLLTNPVSVTVVSPSILDISRFVPNGSPDFGEGQRELRPGMTSEFLDSADTKGPLYATGSALGDGQQASHWQDNQQFGIMDPTLGPGEIVGITINDLKGFGQLGYTINFTPKPKIVALLTSSPAPGSLLTLDGFFFYDTDLMCVFDNGQTAPATSSFQNGRLTCTVPSLVPGQITNIRVSSQSVMSDGFALNIVGTPTEAPTAAPIEQPTVPVPPTTAPPVVPTVPPTTAPPTITAPSSAFRTISQLCFVFAILALLLL